ncbi:MAG TPA: hypothetical protein VK610_03775, partial [Rhodothermales bacterium]|nr:hypothetical protein [Rhodothermales bacterium]
MCRSATLLLLLVLTGGLAAAQPSGLTVTPDTLNHHLTGSSVPFVITNTGLAPLVLDSIVVGVRNVDPGTGALGRLVYGETEAYWQAIAGIRMYWPDGGFPDLTLAPGAEARFYVLAAGYCTSCFGGGGGGPDHHIGVLFYADGDLQPVQRALAFDYIAGLEGESADGGVTLNVAGPNPAHGDARLLLRLGRAADVDLALYDALGRRVRTLVAGSMGAGTHGVDVGAEGLSPGLYF